jgi:hypothetical protein
VRRREAVERERLARAVDLPLEPVGVADEQQVDDQKSIIST